MAKEIYLQAHSIYGAQTRKGLVRLIVPEPTILVTPAEARQYAQQIMEAADAAESDEFIVEFIKEKIGATLEAATTILGDFRKFRENKLKEGKANNG